LASKISHKGVDPVDRIARVLRGIVAEMDQQFGREALNAEIERLSLFADDGSDSLSLPDVFSGR
jgi:hypothetical protein